jgi:hypothetical protein
MKHESSAAIDAPAAKVWAVYSDVARWSEWTPSVQHATPLDGPDLAVGARFAIKQPRLAQVVWAVTAVDPGRSWTWENRSLGITTVGWHEITAMAGGRARVRQGIEQRGLLAPFSAVLMARLTKRYLAMEATGLKARCEQADDNDVRSHGEEGPSQERSCGTAPLC